MNTDDVDHVIFDHLSGSWGIDGIHDLRRGGNFTLQWSIYAEALNESLHHKGPHAMLSSFRDLTGGISLHHNLFASSRERHPTLGGSPRTDPKVIADFRNNVVYNLSGATNLGNCRIDVINNYYLRWAELVEPETVGGEGRERRCDQGLLHAATSSRAARTVPTQ